MSVCSCLLVPASFMLMSALFMLMSVLPYVCSCMSGTQARPDLALATYLNLREPRALELLEAGAGPAGRGAAALLAP
eukprot:scaffold1160_cov17-Tisochrysis_lutea.AAC.1